MKIFLDTAAFRRPGSNRGLGRYSRALVESVSQVDEFEVTQVSSSCALPVNNRLEEWVDMVSRTVFLSRSNFDIFHSTSVYQVPALFLPKTVCSIQDIIPIDYDGYTKTGIKAKFFHGFAPRFGAVVVSSDHTRRRLVEKLAVEPSRIFNAPLPVPLLQMSDAAHTKMDILLPDGPYVCALFDISAPDPRKRLDLFLQVAAILDGYGLKSVVIGEGTESLIGMKGILALGRVSDAEMATVYAGAVCYLYTTEYEGQGLPPQEAMALGTPAVATPNSSLPEMLGDGAVFVDTNALRETRDLSHALAAACLAIAEDETYRSKLARDGVVHISSFSERRFLDGVVAAYSFVHSNRSI
jgi:glycosyltransferase involved in cell wall biosynthesis